MTNINLNNSTTNHNLSPLPPSPQPSSPQSLAHRSLADQHRASPTQQNNASLSGFLPPHSPHLQLQPSSPSIVHRATNPRASSSEQTAPQLLYRNNQKLPDSHEITAIYPSSPTSHHRALPNISSNTSINNNDDDNNHNDMMNNNNNQNDSPKPSPSLNFRSIGVKGPPSINLRSVRQSTTPTPPPHRSVLDTLEDDVDDNGQYNPQ